jgi:ssDNA-binding Zn-finger/Zn-ribbon topoisomerase 1
MVRPESTAGAPSCSRRDIVNLREALDEMATARCPVCRAALVARMGRRGPGFYCQCAKRAA